MLLLLTPQFRQELDLCSECVAFGSKTLGFSGSYGIAVELDGRRSGLESGLEEIECEGTSTKFLNSEPWPSLAAPLVRV